MGFVVSSSAEAPLFESFADHLSYAERIAANHGPNPDEYIEHLGWHSTLNAQIESGKLSTAERNELREVFGLAFSVATLQGHVHLQPFGYAGDYQIIEKIYSNHLSSDPKLRKYDMFFQERLATKAVRNRKRYFQDLVMRLCDRFQKPITVLNLASGPCSEIKELLDANPSLPVKFLCVDVDRSSIEYAQTILCDHSSKVEFTEGNIFRFKPKEHFSLIWSAGLFDYFDDRTFWRVLKRFVPFLSPGGELVIGNFGDWNPTRGYMEALGSWHLHHRSDEKLIDLAQQAGANDGYHIDVGFEPMKVNRFLHIALPSKTIRIDERHSTLRSPVRPQRLENSESNVIREDNGI